MLLTGDGGQNPIGVLNSDGLNVVAKEGAQAADTIIVENLTAMWTGLLPGSHANAIWIASPSAYAELCTMTVTVGVSATHVGIMQSGVIGSPAVSIFGRPLYMSENLPTVGDEGDILLVDATKYILGDRQMFIVDSSPHVRHLYDETAYRVQARFDAAPVMTSTVVGAEGDTFGFACAVAAR